MLLIVGVMSISQETLDRIDHSPESVRLPPESGGGFMGSLEVFHQIHCVVSWLIDWGKDQVETG